MNLLGLPHLACLTIFLPTADDPCALMPPDRDEDGDREDRHRRALKRKISSRIYAPPEGEGSLTISLRDCYDGSRFGASYGSFNPPHIAWGMVEGEALLVLWQVTWAAAQEVVEQRVLLEALPDPELSGVLLLRAHSRRARI